MTTMAAGRPVERLSRAAVAQRLLKTADRHSLDPDAEVDWDTPFDPQKWFAPKHRSSLYGTYLWDRLTEAQRKELLKHELASIYAMGIWFESILMQMLLRHAYDCDPTTDHVRWTFTEIADECRHSNMFAKGIKAFGTPAYGRDRHAHELGRFFKSTSTRPLTFAGTLYVEEILDQLQREVIADESVQQMVRDISRVHVVEEARHVKFARDEYPRQWRHRGLPGRLWSQFLLGGVIYYVNTRLISPAVYAQVGLDAKEARKVARANPHWQGTLTWASRKVMADFEEHGMLGRLGRLWLRGAGINPDIDPEGAGASAVA